LVGHLPVVPKVRGLNLGASSGFSTKARLFKLMTEVKYQIIHMFHMGSVLQITLRWFNVPRSGANIINYGLLYMNYDAQLIVNKKL
jgi:hypothetical protein